MRYPWPPARCCRRGHRSLHPRRSRRTQSCQPAAVQALRSWARCSVRPHPGFFRTEQCRRRLGHAPKRGARRRAPLQAASLPPLAQALLPRRFPQLPRVLWLRQSRARHLLGQFAEAPLEMMCRWRGIAARALPEPLLAMGPTRQSGRRGPSKRANPKPRGDIDGPKLLPRAAGVRWPRRRRCR